MARFLGANDDLADGSSTNSGILNYRIFADGDYALWQRAMARNWAVPKGITNPVERASRGFAAGTCRRWVCRAAIWEIALSWNNGADLQLLVRDPAGNSVFDDTPQVPSGGRLAAAGNVNCSVTQVSPVSYIYWPEGTLTPGLYEVEVWHQNSCNDITPVSFALNVLVNGAPAFTGLADRWRARCTSPVSSSAWTSRCRRARAASSEYVGPDWRRSA